MNRWDEEITLYHKACGGEIERKGEDGIDYCCECETIVEGDPVVELTAAEWEAQYG